MNKFTLILLLMLSGNVMAGDLIIHTHTIHFGSSNGVNNSTPGIGYQFDNNYRVGLLKNSYELPSVYVVKVFPETSRFRFGIGVISGYRMTKRNTITGDRNGAIPLLAAEVDITENVVITWFGQALNLSLKFHM